MTDDSRQTPTDGRDALRWAGYKPNVLSPDGRSAVRRYGVAVTSTALAVVLALIIELPLDVDTNLFLVAAVAISAWYGGRAAGLLSAALSSLAIAGLFIPRNATLAAAGLGEFAYIGAFLIVSLLVSSASGALHAARRAAEFRVNQLRAVTSRLERALQFSEEQSRRMERLLGVIMALPQAMTVADVGKVAVERGLDVLGRHTRGALQCGRRPAHHDRDKGLPFHRAFSLGRPTGR